MLLIKPLFAPLLVSLCMLAPAAFAAEPTFIYLVRHGEKAGSDGDPDLTAQGRARAANIGAMLRKTGIRNVYSTSTARTRQTAAPAAALLSLPVREYDARKPEQLVAEVKAAGGNALVVGHSNTVPKLVSLFGGTPGSDIAEDEFDRVYQLIVGSDGSVTTVVLGSATSH